MKDIILYSTGCPKCMVLKKKLDSAGISYTEVNDVNAMTALGFMSAPMLKVNGKIYSYI